MDAPTSVVFSDSFFTEPSKNTFEIPQPLQTQLILTVPPNPLLCNDTGTSMPSQPGVIQQRTLLIVSTNTFNCLRLTTKIFSGITMGFSFFEDLSGVGTYSESLFTSFTSKEMSKSVIDSSRTGTSYTYDKSKYMYIIQLLSDIYNKVCKTNFLIS